MILEKSTNMLGNTATIFLRIPINQHTLSFLQHHRSQTHFTFLLFSLSYRWWSLFIELYSRLQELFEKSSDYLLAKTLKLLASRLLTFEKSEQGCMSITRILEVTYDTHRHCCSMLYKVELFNASILLSKCLTGSIVISKEIRNNAKRKKFSTYNNIPINNVNVENRNNTTFRITNFSFLFPSSFSSVPFCVPSIRIVWFEFQTIVWQIRTI